MSRERRLEGQEDGREDEGDQPRRPEQSGVYAAGVVGCELEVGLGTEKNVPLVAHCAMISD